MLAAIAAAGCGGGDGPPTSPPPNRAPVVELEVDPTAGPAPLEVRVSLSCSDPDGSVSDYRLDLDDDGAFERSAGIAVDTSVTYADDVSIRGTCADQEGAAGEIAVRDVDVALGAPDGSLALGPEDWTLPVSRAIEFRVDGTGGGDGESLIWSVNGLRGGNSAVGTVDADGRYTAPAEPPPSGSVVVGVTREGSSTSYARAEVTVREDMGGLSVRKLYYQWMPRVVTTGEPDSVELRAVLLEGYASSVTLDLAGQGEIARLRPLRSGTFRTRLSLDQVLVGYRQGDLHTFVGFLEVADGEAALGDVNVFMNVLDGTVPRVSVRNVAEGIQASPHVVNLRYDSLLVDERLPPGPIRRFYDHFPDSYDFLAVVDQVTSVRNRFYRTVQNGTEGIGRQPFDEAEQWGSDGRLLGFLRFPVAHLFDLGIKAAAHEIGHHWMVFLDLENPPLESQAHWVRSSLARGIMGTSGRRGQGVAFPYRVVPVEGDEYELRCSEPASEFNDAELYLMGLLPADSVGSHVVFDDQEIELACGSRGRASTVSIQDVIDAEGPRVPSYDEAENRFRVGTIVLSAGRMLDEREMAFFDRMAARGEAREELWFTSGFSAGMAKPFFLATGGRATLSTEVEP